MKNLLLGLLIALGLLSVSWILLLMWFDGDRLERIGEDYLSQRTGLTAHIEQVSRTVGFLPAVEVHGIHVRAAESSGPLAEVERIEFSFVPWSIIRGRLGFRDIKVSGAYFRAEVDGRGRVLGWPPLVKEAVRIAKKFDFTFVPFRVDTITVSVERAGERAGGTIRIKNLEGSMATLPELTLSVDNIVAEFEGKADGPPLRSVHIREARLERVAGRAPVRLFIEGTSGSGPLDLDLRTGNPFTGDPDESKPLTLHARLGHWKVFAGGSFVAKGARLDAVTVLLDTRRPAFLGRLGLNTRKDGWDFHDLLLQDGRSRVTGRVVLDRAADRPMFDGSFYSSYWEFAGSDRNRSETGSDRQNSRLEWGRVESWLRRYDARIDIHADELVYEKVSLTSVSLPVRLDGNGLSIPSAHGELLGGNVELSADVGVARTGGFDVEAAVEADRLRTAELLESLELDPGMIAGVQGTLELRAQVDTLGNFLPQCNGRLQLTADGGSLAKTLTELGDADLLDLMLPNATDQKRTPLRCAAADFLIESGVLRTKTLIIDTASVKFVGDGSVDLASGSVDMLVVPHGKDFSLLSAQSPLRISGTLEDPEPSLAKGEALQSLLTPIEIGSVENAACQRLIDRVRDHVATAKAAD